MMFADILETVIVPIGLRILMALLVLLIGRWLAGHSRRLLENSLRKTALTDSYITLTKTLSYSGILVLGVLIALAILGVPVTMLVTALGAVLVVLAITLQTSLGNLAASVIFLLFKPFEVGHVVETLGKLGIVQEIQMFNTILMSPDGKMHVLPNGAIQGGGLTNYSQTGWLRLSLAFSISYSSDIDQAKALLTDLLASDDRVLSEPASRVFVQQLADSSVELVVWPHVKVEDFLLFQTDFVESVKKAFDAAGLVIPFPQQDVHLYHMNGSAANAPKSANR